MTAVMDTPAGAKSRRIERLAGDPRELVQRLCFCIARPYAHGVVTMGTETAEAILRVILVTNPSLSLDAEAMLERERLAHQEQMRRRMSRG